MLYNIISRNNNFKYKNNNLVLKKVANTTDVSQCYLKLEI